MMPLDDACLPSLADAIAIGRRLADWLLGRALPLWDAHGVDRRGGGYFETLEGVGADLPPQGAGAIRRGRVVARQMYVFDVGRRLGWLSHGSDPVEHGCRYLFAHLHAGNGLLHTAIEADTRAPCAPFSLYEQAFYLFALARVYPVLGHRYPIAATAAHCLVRLRTNLGKRSGGFEESDPPTLPLKSNPHMHLLEAALAWVAVTTGDERTPWSELAAEITCLCRTRFRDGSSGAIREYFDAEWRPAAGEAGRIVEPGHQYEWAWLLLEWSALPGIAAGERAACVQMARQLVAAAERFGVDAARGLAINELWDDMTVKDADAKLWPQTERIKAWCALLAVAQTPAEAGAACDALVLAASGLAAFLRADRPGLWYELNRRSGGFVPGPSRASSLYHIVGAIDLLSRTLNDAHLPGSSHVDDSR